MDSAKENAVSEAIPKKAKKSIRREAKACSGRIANVHGENEDVIARLK